MSPKINNNLDLITGRTDIRNRPNKMMTEKEEQNNNNNHLFLKELEKQNNNLKINMNQNSLFKKEENTIINKNDNNINNNNNNKIHNILIESLELKPEIENNDNDNNINYEENNIQISSNENYIESIKKVFSQSPKLNLEILNSITLQKGLIIKIDCLGMINNSLRNKRDGFTYFGFSDNKDNKEIDFLIQPKDNYYEQKFIGKHFQIRFNPEDLKYYIIDLGSGFGTFMKIITEIKIKDNYLINLGNSYVVCTFDNDDNEENLENEKFLNLKIFSGDFRSEPIIFNSEEEQIITIGRDASCDVVIEDNLLSRVHCTILYKNGIGWIIRDGKINEEDNSFKPSTNSTWLFLINEIPIYDGMIFKSNQNLFQCNYDYD